MAQKDDFPTIKDALVAQLRRDIISGALVPGEPLKDNDLASRLNVSTSPLREALAQLAMERLVDILPNKSKRVAALDRRIARNFYAVHKLLALAGFCWGAPKIDAPALVVMNTALAGIRHASAVGNPDGVARHVREFLDPVLVACENDELRQQIRHSARWMERLAYRLEIYAESAYADFFHRILDAFLRQDPDAAIAIHQELVDWFEARIECLPEAQQDSAQMIRYRRSQNA